MSLPLGLACAVYAMVVLRTIVVQAPTSTGPFAFGLAGAVGAAANVLARSS